MLRLSCMADEAFCLLEDNTISVEKNRNNGMYGILRKIPYRFMKEL